jgi:hypothetical protein
MAEEAEKAGLVLDWDMLPSANVLDPLAPHHESRLNFSRKDRLTPTIRQVAGQAIDVSFFERLYRPMDEHGNPLPTIAEELHESVQHRFKKEVMLLANDADKVGEAQTYEPRNVAPLIR